MSPLLIILFAISLHGAQSKPTETVITLDDFFANTFTEPVQVYGDEIYSLIIEVTVTNNFSNVYTMDFGAETYTCQDTCVQNVNPESVEEFGGLDQTLKINSAGPSYVKGSITISHGGLSANLVSTCILAAIIGLIVLTVVGCVLINVCSERREKQNEKLASV